MWAELHSGHCIDISPNSYLYSATPTANTLILYLEAYVLNYTLTERHDRDNFIIVLDRRLDCEVFVKMTRLITPITRR